VHIVTQRFLDNFVENHGLRFDVSKNFEAFINYIIFRRYSSQIISPSELVYEGDDPGIDGVMIFLDDEPVSTSEEIDDYLKNRKKDVEVTVVFTQAKTSESWSKSEINTFESAITDFISPSVSYPQADFLKNIRNIFRILVENVGKIKGGRPNCQAFFATTATSPNAREILAARDTLKNRIVDSGVFGNVDVTLVCREQIVSMWGSAEGRVSANLEILASAPFLPTKEIEEGYVVTVRAKEFIEKLLSDANGRLRQGIFDENVRDFLGIESNVNQEMTRTLQTEEKRSYFGILNNGVTIISPDVRQAGLKITLENFQIVNGCQTSNVLFENRLLIDNQVTIMLKIIETSDPTVIDDIVRSTNRQAKINDEQFLATLDCIKSIERYFEARATEEEYPIHFERRSHQFSSNQNISEVRIFGIKEVCRCMAAMFLERPDLASRYPQRLTSELKDLVLQNRYREDFYYTAAYCNYRIKILLSNNKIEQKFSKIRWHLMHAIRFYLLGGAKINLDNRKHAELCRKIQAFMRNDERNIQIIANLCANIVDIEKIDSDKLKTSRLADEVKKRALQFRRDNPPQDN